MFLLGCCVFVGADEPDGDMCSFCLDARIDAASDDEEEIAAMAAIAAARAVIVFPVRTREFFCRFVSTRNVYYSTTDEQNLSKKFAIFMSLFYFLKPMPKPSSKRQRVIVDLYSKYDEFGLSKMDAETNRHCFEECCVVRDNIVDEERFLEAYTAENPLDDVLETRHPRNTRRGKSKQLLCATEGCDTGATFGFEGGKEEFCFDHKRLGMVDVRSQKCAVYGCRKQPVFGVEGGKSEFCGDHKKPGMFDVKSQKCLAGGCRTRPIFGKDGGKAEFCGKHKQPGMIDVKNPKCTAEGCSKQPSYGVEGGKAKFCTDHKKPGMVDVKNPKCASGGCIKKPTFGLEGGRPEFCTDHKKHDMVDVVSTRCAAKGCRKGPYYGVEGEKPEFCVGHKKPGMVDVRSKRCPGPPSGNNYDVIGCPFRAIISNRKAYPNGYCLICDPDPRVQQIRRRTEWATFDELEKGHGLVPHERDFRVDYTCIVDSNKPKWCLIDGVFYFERVVVYFEVDECKHDNYDENCDAARTTAATTTYLLTGDPRPLLWIRYNPDDVDGTRATEPQWRARAKMAAAAIREAEGKGEGGVVYVNYE